MPDRISTIIVRPRFGDLPLDVQAVGLREDVIKLMSEIAEIDRNTLRLAASSEDATIDLGGDLGLRNVWQHDAIAVMYRANGKVHDGVVEPVRHRDDIGRIYSVTEVVRDL